ncbi:MULTISPECIES: hypothetical protein [Streptomyces]|uniref:Serine/threonine protein kinase n=1 Tax=Streptomyces lasiicapitis TaxID=1923961 RepID=A0ABQ2LQX5_9ACTN|nr:MULTISPECIES: hypothetical protein [Streptomyces]QIB47530.1 hypothetical protein G3H79_35065 [Streptomyces aureoverticillatus]GGO42071.1 hypothetical protein GCM10012286_22780 [Streptomyces lasiicapitis]
MTHMHRYAAAVAALAALVAGSTVPSAAASALAAPPASRAAPAAPDRAPHPHAKSVLFDTWFNVQGYSPTLKIHFGVHRYTLKADCDSDRLAGQLYHSATGVDPKVGSAFTVPCNGAPKTINYQLRGGFYYFYFLSGVDNTHIVADGA